MKTTILSVSCYVQKTRFELIVDFDYFVLKEDSHGIILHIYIW